MTDVQTPWQNLLAYVLRNNDTTTEELASILEAARQQTEATGQHAADIYRDWTKVMSNWLGTLEHEQLLAVARQLLKYVLPGLLPKKI